MESAILHTVKNIDYNNRQTSIQPCYLCSKLSPCILIQTIIRRDKRFLCRRCYTWKDAWY